MRMHIFEDMVKNLAHTMSTENFAVASVFLVISIFLALHIRGLTAKLGKLAAAKIENDVRTVDTLRNVISVLGSIKTDLTRLNDSLNNTRTTIDKCSAIKQYEKSRSREKDDD